jgi:hypothetical protein
MTSTRTHPYAIPQFKLVVNDLAGSDRFFQQVPINTLHNLLSECTLIVLSLLYPPEYSADVSTLPGGITTITLFLEDFEGVAFTCNNEVHFSTSYINSIDSARVLHEIRGALSIELPNTFAVMLMADLEQVSLSTSLFTSSSITAIRQSQGES